MPTEFWYPISSTPHDLPASSDDFTAHVAANKNVACRPSGGRAGPIVHDDTTWDERTGAGTQALNIDWPGPISVLTGVFTGAIRHSGDGSSVNRFSRFTNAAGTSATVYVNVTDTSASFVSSSLVDVSNAATYRPDGGSWVVADYANDQTIFVRIGNASAGTAYVSSVWGELGYEPPAGGFAFLLQLAGLGALPFVGAMDFGHFTRYLAWRRAYHPRHTLMRDRAEILRAWDDVKSYRHPAFFLPKMA